jgi:hypothetical protein
MEVLIERLVQRYESDSKATEEVYKDRLWNLTFIEPKEWTAKAYSGEHFYDQVFDTFTLSNQSEVFSKIQNNVALKLNNSNNQKRKP